MVTTRITSEEVISVQDAAADATAIDISKMSGFTLHCPSTLSSTTVTVYTLNPNTAAYNEMTDKDGTALTMTVAASKSIACPSDVFFTDTIKLVFNNSGDDGRIAYVTLKG